MDGFMIGYDPCHGFDDDHRSPYYRDPRPQVGVCDLCGEPIYEDERIIYYKDKVVHYDDVFSNMSDKDMAAFTIACTFSRTVFERYPAAKRISHRSSAERSSELR